MQTRLFPLQKTFEVGDAEKHVVTVRYAMSGRETVWVDDKQVWNRLNVLPNSSIHLAVGEDERHDLELRVSYQPFRCSAWLDGAPHTDNLFPEVTPSAIHAETVTTIAPYVSAGLVIVWLALGSRKEIEPMTLIMIAACAAVWTALLVKHWRRPRLWSGPALIMAGIILINAFSRHKGSQSWHLMMPFFAVAFGLIAVLGPRLRR